MFTAKSLFKAEFFRVRAIVRAMSDSALTYANEESYEFQYPTHYYRFVSKEIRRRGYPTMPEPTYEESSEIADESNDLRDMLEKALAM